MQNNWRILASGTSDRAVVAMDFGPGSRDAGMSDLVANLTADAVVWQPVFHPQTDDPISGTDPDRLVREWLHELRGAGLRVSGVLGYCAGAALALRMADQILAGGDEAPPVVLLEPERVDSSVIQAHFVASAESYAEVLPPERIKAAVTAAARISSPLGAGIADWDAWMRADALLDLQGLYDDLVRAVCESFDAGEEVGTGISYRFAAFLSYMVTAGRAGADPTKCSVTPTVVVSEHHELHEGFGVASHRIPVSRSAFLADQSVARVVAEAVR
ncbi:hypothetical protein ONA91_15290 [Micromonospora sp. DR5-3]|uniref:hypothetical protein n=1 Tax=unclassified Micromonospora TaxID=2617518 RepID=UPI0011DC1545|nr:MULTISPECIES: hypothetical protein [unclassified Micromonospora]MCW3815812.1 hypothetical protein [Micromonospora sp. DR5-3]TYC21206.1 hypothetical protein FXF52_27190 [Micromonospora sp. MP36]